MPITINSLRSENHLALRLRLTEGAAPAERSLHIGILLDNSGSMEGRRLVAVKRTLTAARSLLRPGDRLTLVTFSNHARVCLEQYVLTDDAAMDAAFTAINAIHTEGSTDLSVGLEALYAITTHYDAVILLTDGIINAGITSQTGLRSIALAPAHTLTFHTLGYGADHNRGLLRELAVASRGTYTYVDSDEILPIAMGDILSGLRAEVARSVRVSIQGDQWHCLEVSGTESDTRATADYNVGNMVPGRDYWAVFSATRETAVEPVVFLSQEGAEEPQMVDVPVATDLSPIVLMEQVLRARVAKTLNRASTLMETGGPTERALVQLRELQTEIADLTEAERMRPLILRLNAQLAEVVEGLESVAVSPVASPSHRTPTRLPALRSGGGGSAAAHLMARMSSGAACLSTQRGVYRAVGVREDSDEDDTNTSFFSSPAQRTASQTVYSTYRPTAAAGTAATGTAAEEEPAEPLVQTPHSSNSSVGRFTE